jgi:three-Cys-motif partner protein
VIGRGAWLVPANEAFFVHRKPAAAFKHGILSRYSTVFAAKAGSVTGGKVVFLDGYAGPGRYDDGTEGSPGLFLRAARRNPQRRILNLFVERDPDRCGRLRQVLDEIDPTQTVLRRVYEGDLSRHLPELLYLAEPAALFAFLDPFGTALELSGLRQLLWRSRRTPTEVLLHFSVSTIARMGGVLHAARRRPGGLSLADHKTLAHADAFLGGEWWRSEFDALPALRPDQLLPASLTLDDVISDPAIAEDPTLDEPTLRGATQIAMRIADRFSTNLARQAGYNTIAMPVRAEPTHLPKYVLVLFTRNPHGVWHFASALGRAGLIYQEALHEHRRRAREQRHAGIEDTNPGLFSTAELRRPAPFDRVAYERARFTHWISAIVTNLHRLLTTRDPHGHGLLLTEHIHEVYGDLLGHAWEKHVRAAVKQLHDDDYISDDGTQNFWLRRIALFDRRQSGGARDSLPESERRGPGEVEDGNAG